MEHLAEHPLPRGDQDPIDLEPADPGGQDGEAVGPVHRADQTVLASPSGACGMSTVGSTTVSAGSPSGVSPFQLAAHLDA